MRLLSATRYSVKTCLNSSLLRPPIVSSINPCFPQHLARAPLQPSFAAFRRTFTSSGRLFQQPTLPTDRDHDPEEKTKPSIGEKLQAVRAEKIWTIPNVLTISRILSCPVLCYTILHDNFYVATGLLVYAGLTDLVRVHLPCFTAKSRSPISSFHAFRSTAGWREGSTWARFLVRFLTRRPTKR